MADEFSITVSGIEDACAMLDRVPKETARVGVARGLAAAAVPIFEAVVSEYKAHGTQTPATGKMMRALRTDIAMDANGYSGVASINFGREGHKANWVEYGHRMVAHGVRWADRKRDYEGKLLGPDVKPYPFLRPAAARSGEAAVEAFIETLGKSLVDGTTWADVAEAAA